MKYRDGRITISALIERSFIMAIISVVVIVIISTFYINQRSLQESREVKLEKIHEILSSLIAPVLSISDVSEVRKLLQLASSKEEIFAVVDNTGNVLMPDYSNLNLVDPFLSGKNFQYDCNNLHATYRVIGQKSYWVNCTQIKSDNFLHQKNPAYLLSFSSYKWIYLAPILITFLVLVTAILVFLIIWFRQLIYRRLMSPLVLLGNKIINSDKLKHEVFDNIDSNQSAPYEIYAIEKSFNSLLKSLKSMYQLQTEAEKKTALFDLAAKVAHDIRSPVAVLEMTLSVFAEGCPPELISIQTQAIQNIRDIAESLLLEHRSNKDIISDASSLSTSNQPAETIILTSIVEKMIILKKQEWLANPCEIEFVSNEATVEIMLPLSANSLLRMLSNLMNNAYEAMGQIKKIVISIEKTNNETILSITDNGAGIPEDKINLVLNGASLKANGNGLGLSSAKKLIESIGGKLLLTSEVNIGTRISLIFAK